MSRIAVLRDLDPGTYQRNLLHAKDRIWIEKNCYVDVWIEALHTLGLNPLAMLPFTVAIDFEGDQWTFYKPAHDELRDLYGIDVQELNVWRPLVEHAIEHLGAGKLISTEADAFWLPDTAGTDYRRQHTKSTIVLADIDVDAQRLGYFHNAGYYSLGGEDFRQLFRINFPPDPDFVPLFAELVRIDRAVNRAEAELAAMSWRLLRKHLLRLPLTNPISRFKQRFLHDLPWIQSQGLPFYHAWAFGTLRQLGSAFELAALNLRWLATHSNVGVESAAAAFDGIASTCKSLILKVARAVNARRPLESGTSFQSMAEAWTRGMGELSGMLAGCSDPGSEAHAPAVDKTKCILRPS